MSVREMELITGALGTAGSFIILFLCLFPIGAGYKVQD